ncbi:hypothetical protein CDL12_21294 [Handroanthus impetiginosus]|uniref:Uncharacterized protein n=1 Tax=Handroanthus impetiginosus TaxID=429701 RepID=A0A2G9GLM0_9LAMI|nr:hypothetical protein CDL12_21294 [Handroanthus impetiginosus]
MAPSSCPSPAPTASKKLLVSDPKPRPKPKPRPESGPFTAPPNSTSSSSTTNTAPPEKRTRDQPNLSDCHGCGRRINYTNSKDRLQPLDSVWRIVLLCRKCRKNLYSGHMCPYCFQGTGNSGDLVTCRVCERKIHKDCVRDYRNCTPWCYLSVGLEGFRVCVDCWVPDLLKNSIRVCGRSENKARLKGKGEARDFSEKVAKHEKCGMEKKVKVVPKAKEQGLRRDTVAKNAVDLANGGLDLSAKKDKDGSETENTDCGGAIEVVDDAELAIQLHRVMNSSPRISRSKCLVNSNALDALNIRKWNGLSYKRSRFGKQQSEGEKLQMCRYSAEDERMKKPRENGPCIDVNGLNVALLPYKRDKNRRIWQLNDEKDLVAESMSNQLAGMKINFHSDDGRTRYSMTSSPDVSEDSIPINADCSNSCINGDRLGQALISYQRRRFKQKACQVNGLLGVSEECSPCDNHGGAFKPEYCQSDDTGLRTGCLLKNDTEVILPSESCDAERDRYHLKYLKRVTGTKSDSSFLPYGTFLSENPACEPALSYSGAGYDMKCDGKLFLPNGTSNWNFDRYFFKYAKRVKSSKSGSISEDKLHSDAILNEIGASAPGLTRNCSAESRTLSDVSCDSFTIHLPK